MIVVLSPAKTLDYETPLPTQKFSEPDFLSEAADLIGTLRDKSDDEIKNLMKLSDNLTKLNVERYSEWSQPFTPDNARPGIFAFKGDVYVGLEAKSFNDDDVEFAQNHLRILSGLYGVLRPLDLMQPYRLEMGTRLETDAGSNLYKYWGSKISQSLNEAQPKGENSVLVNLASNEYFSAIDKKTLDAEIITPAFYDWKNGKYKMISFYAKKARGMMASWIIKNKITDPQKLALFDVDGYSYSTEMSENDKPVFARKQE